MEKEILLTEEGLKKLETELEVLKTIRRKEIAERIKAALAFGDLTENSEYDEAKNEQALSESRIMELENVLRNAQVVAENKISTEAVFVGCKVKLEQTKTGKKVEYRIVGSSEANPLENKISNESPIGSALIGKGRNEVVSIKIPSGIAEYKILDISK
ncbi:MAG: transcription elongation factor GreA [Oscillospiraceae bacterium]|nr:transcription elongation factor GreA [Oscillospiraceae bacterium]